MKNIAFLATVAIFLAGNVQAQQMPQDLIQWLIEYFNYDKTAAYEVINGVQDKVKQEFPMDQKLVDGLKVLDVQQQAAMADLAKKNGYSDVNEFYSAAKYKSASGDWTWFNDIQNLNSEYSTARSNLTASYTAEFNKRVTEATNEAIKRLQVNANAMK
jgi:hypothetical protein